MTNKNPTCTPAKSLAAWPLVSARGVRALSDNASVSCSASLPPDRLKDCQSYTALSNYIGIGGGLLQTSALIIYQEVHSSHPDLATDLWYSCGTIYTMLSGVNDELLVAIEDINKGQLFVPIVTPAAFPDFPPAPPKGSIADNVIQSVWLSIKSVLNNILAHYQGHDKLRIVLAGLIENGDKAMQMLIPILKQLFG